MNSSFKRPYLVTDWRHDSKGHCQRDNMPNKPFYKFRSVNENRDWRLWGMLLSLVCLHRKSVF